MMDRMVKLDTYVLHVLYPYGVCTYFVRPDCELETAAASRFVSVAGAVTGTTREHVYDTSLHRAPRGSLAKAVA